MSDKPTYRDILKRKKQAIQQVASTQPGKELFQILEDAFCHSELIGKDSRETELNVARRDVVMYLIELRDDELPPEDPAHAHGLSRVD